MVGAEISGPALPRFTSGVAAARLVKEAALHEQHLNRDAQNLRIRTQFACEAVLRNIYTRVSGRF